MEMLAFAQRLDLPQRDHRRRQGKSGQRGVLVQQMRPWAYLGVQRDDTRLTQRVDRRVGHLREPLPEVRIDGPRRLRQKGQRSIVAHRPHRILAVGGHRLQDHLHIFAGVAESPMCGGKRGSIDGGDWYWIERRLLNQLGIRRALIEQAQQRLILIELMVFEIHQKHLARSQTATVRDLFRIEIDETNLRTGNNQAVPGHSEAAWPQSIAVERRAYYAAVAEGQSRRAIPRLGAVHVVAQEGRGVRSHDRRRKQHSDRLGKRSAVLRKQLNRLIETG